MIRNKARVLARNALLRASGQDEEEVEQQLLVQLWSSLRHFNHRKGNWHAYATTVVGHAARRMLDYETASKRDRRRTVSLHARRTSGADSFERNFAPDSSATRSRLGCRQHDDLAHAELSMDLEEVISGLPAHWRKLLQLRRTHSMHKAAEKMGVPRSTARGWLYQMSHRFEKADIFDYFKD